MLALMCQKMEQESCVLTCVYRIKMWHCASAVKLGHFEWIRIIQEQQDIGSKPGKSVF